MQTFESILGLSVGLLVQNINVASGKRMMTLPVDLAKAKPDPDRLLVAIEIIAKHGPLSADTLRAQLNLPKTVVWRLIKKLREAGWIRLRHGGHLIELDVRLDELFATAHFADREFSAVGDIMVSCAESGAVHFDLFSPDHTGRVQLQETTRRLTAAKPAYDANDEMISQLLHVAVQLQADPSSAIRRSRISGIDAARLDDAVAPVDRSLMQNGFGWDADKVALCVAVVGRMGTPAAIQITSKTRAPRPEILCAAFQNLRRSLHGHVTAFARAGQNPR